MRVLTPIENAQAAATQLSLGSSQRVESVDIFRGLTILVMIFVNDLSGVRGLPWWTYHMPGRVNGMTYVDMVFPAFLFILGVSVPLASERRIAKGDSKQTIIGHVALRSVALFTMGIFLANSSKLDPAFAGISRTAWNLLGFAGIFLLWSVYPKTASRRALYRTMQVAGLLLLVAVFALFRRRTEQGNVAWLDFGYWEILGLIGWAYLGVSILYLLFRGRKTLLFASLVGLLVLNVLSTAGWLNWMGPWRRYWPFEAGLCLLAMTGVMTSIIFFDNSVAPSFREKATLASGYAATLLALGWVLSPLGISKIYDTPSWCLLCAGSSVLLLLSLYWVVDVHGRNRWAAFVKPAGSNTLLTYLLPDVWYSIPALAALSRPWSAGAPGVVRAFVFTGVILGLAAVFTRRKLRLQL